MKPGKAMVSTEELEARAAAVKLVTALGGRQRWTAVVFENIGWHYAARSVDMRLHVVCGATVQRPYAYLAFLGAPDEHTTGRWTAYGATPRRAVDAVLAKAAADVEELKGIIEEAKAATGHWSWKGRR